MESDLNALYNEAREATHQNLVTFDQSFSFKTEKAISGRRNARRKHHLDSGAVQSGRQSFLAADTQDER